MRALRRTREGRLFAGVCAGLGRYFDVSPVFYRIAFAALTLFGGAGIVIYIVAWLVIPEEGAEDSIAAEALSGQRDRPWLLVGLGLVALAILFAGGGPPGPPFWAHSGGFWIVLLAGGAAIVWWQLSRRERPAGPDLRSADASPTGTAAVPARERRPSLFAPASGVLLAAGGLLALLDATDVLDVDWDVAFAAGVVLVGVAMAIGGWWRRTAGLAVLGLVLALVTAAGLAVDRSFEGGIGERSFRPAASTELEPEYRLAFGHLEVDLRYADLPEGDTSVEASVGVGELVVHVPEDVAVLVQADAEAGDISVLGHHDDGFDASERVVDDHFAAALTRLVVIADVGLGEINVRRSES